MLKSEYSYTEVLQYYHIVAWGRPFGSPRW